MTEAEAENTVVESDAPQSGAGGDRGDRSGTRYPYYNLEEALGFARAVQETGGNEAREEDVLKHLDVSKTTKTWIYKLSSAREFGLVEKKGQKADTRIALTALGSRLLLPGDQNEMMASRIHAFLTPPLYQKLFERYKGAPVPQTAFLKGLLVREHKILDSVSEAASDAFVASAKYAGLINEKNAFVPKASPVEPTPPNTEGEKEKKTKGNEEEPPPAGKQSIHVPADYIIYKTKISGQRILEIPLPRDFTQRDVKKLTAFLETQIDDDEDMPE